MFKFEELRVYQEAIKFVDRTYQTLVLWPKSENYGLSDQFRRASTSIALNIAEGSGRTAKDFQHFISNARGSCYECVAIITIAKNRNYINQMNFNELYESCHILAKMLSALKRSISYNSK